MRSRAIGAAACAALALGVAQDAAARGNAESGKIKAAQVCALCHGADGAKPSAPEQPVLAGQYYEYLVKALSDYKSGKRNNATMKGFVVGLSRQDMEDLAAWFASRQSSLHFQR